MEALSESLGTLEKWPVQIRYMLFQRICDELSSRSFELAIHQERSRSLSDNIYRKGGKILDEYLTLLTEHQCISAARKIASCKFVGDDLHLRGSLLGEPQLFPLVVEFNHL